MSGPFRLPTKSGTAASHRPNCLCCVGPPDDAFERACAAVATLAIDGVGASEAERFVRLCVDAGGGEAVALSKGKAKAARRGIRKGPSASTPLEASDVARMQDAVLTCYARRQGDDARRRRASASAATTRADPDATDSDDSSGGDSDA